MIIVRAGSENPGKRFVAAASAVPILGLLWLHALPLAVSQRQCPHPSLLDGVRITGRQTAFQLSKTYAISGNPLVARPLQNTPRQRGWCGRTPRPRKRRITGDFK